MAEAVYVKYCPLCGAENPRQAAFCARCLDGDLTTVPDEPRRDDAPAPAPLAAPVEPPRARCTLTLIENPALVFTVCEGQTVGRTRKADVPLTGVPKLEWISGSHARFFRRGPQWFVQHIAQTNFIKVDGDTFRGNEEVALHDGSVLVLSLTAFRVKLE
jgi:ribosomal protein L40E